MSEGQELIRDLRATMERLENALSRLGSGGNSNVVKLEGAGSIWNGIAIGVALGATIVSVGWISTKLQEQDVTAKQAEAYSRAVYALAPRFAEEIDKELDRQKE